VGGTEASAGEFPYQVSMQSSSGFPFCGATLVAPGVAVSAAHCGSADRVQIGMVTKNQNPDGCVETFNVRKTLLHESYDSSALTNDISLIFFDEKSSYMPARLYDPATPPPNGDLEAPGTQLWVTGYGALSEGGSQSSNLQKVQVPVITNQQCSSDNGDTILDSQICAGISEGGIDSCQGDSGGPLAGVGSDAAFYLIGVVSWGIGCARPERPGVYTRVSKYRDWVCNNIRANGDASDAEYVCGTLQPTMPTPPTPSPAPTSSPAPTPAPLCTYDSVTFQYDGQVNTTRSGIVCQVWSAETPHIGNYLTTTDHNYCRNPDNDSEGPWCYTTDPDVRWQYCDVGTYANPICVNPTASPTTPTPTPTTTPTATPTAPPPTYTKPHYHPH
jgi:hypothetical protein